jgi:thymidylate synthase
MREYTQMVEYVLDKGTLTSLPTRTGERTLKGKSCQMHYDLSSGRFPLLTTREMNFHAIAAELEGYLKGITDKQWYKDNGCSFWNEWANESIVKKRQQELDDFSDKTKKEIQKEERDIGPGYGWSWLHDGAEYSGYETDYTGKGVNQLQNIVEIARKNPFDRRMIIIALNTKYDEQYSMRPCVYSYNFSTRDGKTLDLTYIQRSCDIPLGGANDFAEGALFLILVARACGMVPGVLTAQIADPHIYENSIIKIADQITREPYPLPVLDLKPGVDCFNFTANDAKLLLYKHHPKINYTRSV